MTHRTECCEKCYGRMGTLAGGGVYCFDKSCTCHTPTDDSVVDWEKEFDGWANNVVEHDSERAWAKSFIRSLLTSQSIKHKEWVKGSDGKQHHIFISEDGALYYDGMLATTHAQHKAEVEKARKEERERIFSAIEDYFLSSYPIPDARVMIGYINADHSELDQHNK